MAKLSPEQFMAQPLAKDAAREIERLSQEAPGIALGEATEILSDFKRSSSKRVEK